VGLPRPSDDEVALACGSELARDGPARAGEDDPAEALSVRTLGEELK
jgi:hypothetical protein